MTSDIFQLSWNDFVDYTTSSVNGLLADEHFTDVTLACEGGKKIKAHKVILSSCSDFFKTILTENPHEHPLLYLRGVKFTELRSLVNFIYLGKTEVHQDKMESFMATAKDLQVKGLFEEESLKQQSLEKVQEEPVTEEEIAVCNYSDEEEMAVENDNDENGEVVKQEDYFEENTLCKVQEREAYEDQDDINEDELPSQTLFDVNSKHTCRECGKVFSNAANLSRHNKSAHQGVRYPCNYCEYQGTTSSNVKRHMLQKHTF